MKTRTRAVALFSLVLALGGSLLAARSLEAARPRDTLNPGIPTRPAGKPLTQPIPFSHKIHTGKLGMDCAYCHSNVARSAVATIPYESTCMNCHQYALIDRPNIQKLTKYYTSGQTIPWLKVHDIPDHANFNHKRHVRAGVSCFTCHGDVRTMDVLYPVVKLNMGFCVTCHKANRENQAAPANLDCYTCHK